MANLQDLLIKIGVDPAGVKDGLDKASGFFDRNKGAMAAGAGAVGAGAAALFSKGLMSGMDAEAATSKLTAQLGLTATESGRMGKTAGKLFASGYGESIEDVNAALRAVVANMDGMRKASSTALEETTTRAMNLATVMDEDVNGVTRAVSQMLRTGIAKDGKEAFDVLTKATQMGLNANEDLLDTFNEYSTQFRNIGVSAPAALGLVRQMMQGGARDADVAADAVKEFADLTTSGSESAAASFKALGLEPKKMFAIFSKGGPEATKAFDLVMQKLQKFKGKANETTITSGLFGDKVHDLGAALFAMDPSKATTAIGDFSGAADEAGDALADNAKSGIEVWTRKTDALIQKAAGAPGVMGDTSQAVIGVTQSILPMGEGLGGIAIAGLALVKMGGPVIGMFKMVGTAFLTLGKLFMTNPWMLVVIGLVILVMLVIKHWDTIKKVLAVAWAWIQNATKVTFDAVWGAIKWVWDQIVFLFLNFTGAGLIIKHWDKIVLVTKIAWKMFSDLVTGGVRWVLNAIGWLGALPGRVRNWFGRMNTAVILKTREMIAWVRGLPDRISRGLGNMGRLLLSAGSDLIRGLWNGIVGMGSWLGSRILQFMRDHVPGPILKFFGISSPSKMFAGIGGDVVAGLALGMDRGHKLVEASSSNLAGAALEAAVVRTKKRELTDAGMRLGEMSVATTKKRKAGITRQDQGFLIPDFRNPPGHIKSQGKQTWEIVTPKPKPMPSIRGGGTGGGGGGGEVKVTFDVKGSEGFFKKWVRELIRIEGRGDVQIMFGRKKIRTK